MAGGESASDRIAITGAVIVCELRQGCYGFNVLCRLF
jgi:hypothetical protein